MSFESLQAIVGTALVDRKFCEMLLVSPQVVARGFDLSDVEIQAVASIRAQTLEEFAAKIDSWIDGESSPRCDQRAITGVLYDAYRLAG